MGLAAWRAHHRLGEHAAVAPAGGTISGSTVPVIRPAHVLGLNEVGVTDLVVAAIWRHGPRAAAYAISPAAEANHLGADIAILHPKSQRLLLYQAKLAHCDAGIFLLKSPVTKSQLRLLNRRSVSLQNSRYRITGRLALYQVDHTPYIDRCDCHAAYPWSWRWWPHVRWLIADWDARVADDDREVARSYYKEMLVGCGCSSSGVVAAPVPRPGNAVAEVAAALTWPWEFDTYSWLHGESPLDGNASEQREPRDLSEVVPDFAEYQPTVAEPPTPAAAAEMARELAERLRLPSSRRLHLVVLA